MKTETLREYLGRVSADCFLSMDELNEPASESALQRIHDQCQKGFAVKAEVELSVPETQEEANALFQDVHSKARPPVKLLRIVLEPL